MMKKIPGWVKITGLVLVVCVIVIAGGIFALYSLWMKDSREVVENLAQYEEILGQNGRYKKNYVEYNDIFPDQLPESADVETFYYEYYNPWDANYLGYLVYTCDEDDFRTEYDRLHKIKSSALPLIYGATGFPYELCAVYTDEYSGYIYALADVESKTLIYVSLEFCNYFTDIDYEEIIDNRYLPYGFDAKNGNATQSAKIKN